MKKILIIYNITHQTQLVQNIIDYVSDEELLIDALNINTWEMHSIRDHHIPCKYEWYKHVLNLFKKKYIPNITIGKFLIKKIWKDYDIVDFHYFSPVYDYLIPLVKKDRKKVRINIWGSDYLRASAKRKRQQSPLYQMADLIQIATQQMYDEFIKDFPQCAHKMSVLDFGTRQLEYIKGMDDSKVNSSFLKNYDGNKIIIVCGYNGAAGQQHLIMLNSIMMLPAEKKDMIHIVLPMTYGTESDYLQQVLTKANMIGVSYDILTNRLTDDELVCLRKLSKIAVNIQITDAFSSSLVEHIYCGAILIVGEWLPYRNLDNAGVWHIKTSINDLSTHINTVLSDIDSYTLKAKMNKDIIYNMCSWDILSAKWKVMYKSM